MEEIQESPCLSCGESVLEGSEFCPACFAAAPGRGRPSAPVESIVEPDASPVAAPDATPDALDRRADLPTIGPDADAPRCTEHPERPIATTCERCGRFLCIDCEPTLLRKEKVTCRGCVEQMKISGAPKRIRRIVLELAMTYLVTGGMLILFITVLPIFTGVATGAAPEEAASKIRLIFILVGSAVALPFILSAMVLLFTRSVIAAWVGFGLVAILGLMALTVVLLGGPLMGLIVVLVMVLAFLRCLELGTLKGLLKKQAA